MKKRFLAVCLALALCAGLVPTAFAAKTRFEDVKRGDAELSEIVFSQDPLGAAEVYYLMLDPEDLSKSIQDSIRVVIVPDGTTISAPSYPKEEGNDGHIGSCVSYITGPGTTGSMFQGLMGYDWYEDSPVEGMEESADTVDVISVRVYAGSVEVPTGDENDQLIYRYYDEINLISESAAKYLASFGTTYISPVIPMTVAKFTDLSPNGFYLDAVTWAVANGVTNGKTEGSFAPNENCTHGQILTFLWRAAGEPEEGIKTPIANVEEGNYFYKAAQWANDMGMIDPGGFNPAAPCTRADAVTYIWQAFGSPDTPLTSQFTDVAAEASYAQAVAWAVKNGVTNGATATAFNPGGICNRGQIVTFLDRAYQ